MASKAKKRKKASKKKHNIKVVVKNKHIVEKQNPEPVPAKKKTGIFGWFGKFIKAASVLFTLSQTVHPPQ